MTALLKKEFRLAVSPTLYIFFILSALLLIPNYPSAVAVGFCFQAVYLYFSLARGTRDVEFSLILPVSRRDIVKGKMAVAVLLELTHLALCACFALLADFVVSPAGNPVGLDANFAFFGVMLLGLSTAHLVFFPWVFRRISRPGIPHVTGLLGFCGVDLLFELLVNVLPSWKWALDSLAPATAPYRLILLGIGLAAFVGSLLASFALARRSFEKTSL